MKFLALPADFLTFALAPLVATWPPFETAICRA
jgi:hypothetical protein